MNVTLILNIQGKQPLSVVGERNRNDYGNLDPKSFVRRITGQSPENL